MNATTKKTGSGKRAAFAIEEAIADTRSRIAASAGADLKQKAQAALSSAQPETHAAMIERITQELRADTRRRVIDATDTTEDNAQRWAKRVKAAKALLRGITVNDYDWGAAFEGTKAALVRAGLVDDKRTPKKAEATTEYYLPLNREDGYKAACYGPTFGAVPQSWHAKCNIVPEVARAPKGNPLLSIHVMFNSRDVEVRERMRRAIAELERPDMNSKLLRMLILEIPPVPLSVQIPEAIEAAKKYPTEKQRLAWRDRQDRKRNLRK